MQRTGWRLLTVGSVIAAAGIAGVAWAGIGWSGSPPTEPIAGPPPAEVLDAVDAVDGGWEPGPGSELEDGVRVQLRDGTLTAWFYRAANGATMASIQHPEISAVGACDRAAQQLRLCSATVWGTTFVLLGRASPQIAGVSAHYADGTVVAGTVADSVWVMDLPTPGDPALAPEMFEELVIVNADGERIAKGDANRATEHVARASEGAQQLAEWERPPAPAQP